LIAFALALGLAGEAASAARVVNPASARQAIANSAIVAVDAELSALAADGRATDLAARLDLIAHDRTIADVAQEWLLDRGLHALARLEPTARSRETVLRLASRTPIVFTRIDPDHGERATPLYDTGATARFVLRHWERNAARKAAEADLAAGRTATVERFAGRAGHGDQDAARAGISDAFKAAAPSFLSSQEDDGASAVSHRLQSAIDQFNAQAVPTMKLSMSVGIEELPGKTDIPLDELLSRADRAMYEKKRRRS
jgi:hypothetical protein